VGSFLAFFLSISADGFYNFFISHSLKALYWGIAFSVITYFFIDFLSFGIDNPGELKKRSLWRHFKSWLKDKKRNIYILLSIFLGILLGIIAEALVERAYINSMLSQGIIPVSTWGGCYYLPPIFSALFLAGGAALGYVLGVRWWQLVYVEHRHWKMGKK
jgi:polyferredoxin